MCGGVCCDGMGVEVCAMCGCVCYVWRCAVMVWGVRCVLCVEVCAVMLLYSVCCNR